MGVSIRLSLISASNYFQHLRPKLIQHYGRINQARVKSADEQRVRIGNTFKILQNLDIQALRNPKKLTDGPLRKYLKSGGLGTQQSYQQMQDCFYKYTKQLYFQKNHFLVFDDYLQEIESFFGSGEQMKVSNMLQVENYCIYLEGAKKTLQQHPNCEWSSLYSDIGESIQMITDCYQTMKQEKEETLLIFD